MTAFARLSNFAADCAAAVARRPLIVAVTDSTGGGGGGVGATDIFQIPVSEPLTTRTQSKPETSSNSNTQKADSKEQEPKTRNPQEKDQKRKATPKNKNNNNNNKKKTSKKQDNRGSRGPKCFRGSSMAWYVEWELLSYDAAGGCLVVRPPAGRSSVSGTHDDCLEYGMVLVFSVCETLDVIPFPEATTTATLSAW